MSVDGDKLRVDETFNAVGNDKGQSVSHLLVNDAYSFYWPGGAGTAYQYPREGDDARQAVQAGQLADAQSDLLVKYRAFGNSVETLKAYKERLGGDLTWTATPDATRPGGYLLRLEGPNGYETLYAIDPARSYAITEARTLQKGQLIFRQVNDLAKTAGGLWFPRQVGLYDYAPDGAVRRQRQLLVRQLDAAPAFAADHFEANGLGLADTNEVIRVARGGVYTDCAVVGGAIIPKDVAAELGGGTTSAASSFAPRPGGRPGYKLLSAGAWAFGLGGLALIAVYLLLRLRRAG